MLDIYLETAHKLETEKTAQAKMVEDFTKLPTEELMKIANGEAEKVGFFSGGDDWLDKFKGSPFFEKAVELEQQAIQNQTAEQQQRESQHAQHEQFWNQRDRLCLSKRLLSVELAQWEEQSQGGPEGVEADAPPLPVAPPPPAPPGDALAAPPPAAPPAAPAGKTEVKVGSAFQVDAPLKQLTVQDLHDTLKSYGLLKAAAPRRVAPGTKHEVIGAEEKNQGAGQLGAYSPDPMDNVWGSEAKAAAAVKIASANNLARALARADFQKLGSMNAKSAKWQLDDIFQDAVITLAEEGRVSSHEVASLGSQMAIEQAETSLERAKDIEQNPNKHRLQRATLAAMPLGLIGAFVGRAAGRKIHSMGPDLGTLAGGLTGIGLGGLAAIPKPTPDFHRDHAKRLKESLKTLSQEQKIDFARQSIAETIMNHPLFHDLEKESSAKDDGSSLQKTSSIEFNKNAGIGAVLTAMGAGAKGIGKFLGSAGKGVGSSYRTGGAGAAGRTAKTYAGDAVHDATEFAKKNPGAALGLTAVGAGGAGLAAG